MTIPAIAPPLSPLSFGAATPIAGDPSVCIGVSKGWVVVAEPVSVAAAALLLVPSAEGADVIVAQMEELPARHWPFSQTDAGPQQVLPHFVSPTEGSQLPDPEPAPTPPVGVAFAR